MFSTVRSQHIAASLAAASVTVLASLVGVFALNLLDGRLRDITERSWPTADMCMEFWIGSLGKHRAGYRLLRGDLQEASSERAWASSFTAGSLEVLKRSGELPPATILELERLDAASDAALDDLVRASGAPDDPLEAQEAMHRLDLAVAAIERAVAPLEEAMDRSMDGAAAGGMAVARRARSFLWVVAAAGLAGAFVISLTMTSRLVRPLHRLTEMTRRLAEGAPVEPIAVRRRDEVGELTSHFDRMVADLAASRERLTASEARYRTLFEYARHGMVVLDEGGTIIEVNTTFGEMAGISRAELPGRHLREILPVEARDGLLRRLQLLLETGRHATELELLRPDGSRVPAEGGGVRLPDGRTVLSLRDVTQRRRMEQALVQSEKLSAVGQLAAGVAHELRNPLFVISNVLYDLRETLGEQHPSVVEDLQIASEESRRARGIIDNLLEFSRPAAFEACEIEPGPLIQQVLRLFHEALQQRGIALDLRLGAGPRCHFHPDAFKQVLVNLLSNAMDAMPAGGRLTVASSGTQEGRVQVRVEDTGEGIPPDRQNEIFNPFYSNKPPGRGTGLGLWIVHSTVHRYRGHVGVESEEGRGTVFTLDLCAAGEGV